MSETAKPVSRERLEEIRSMQLGDWYAGPWLQGYVEGDGEEPAYYRVTADDGTVLATLPDFAGPVAVWMCDAHDAVPELLAEHGRLREAKTADFDRDPEALAWARGKVERALGAVTDLAASAERPGREEDAHKATGMRLAVWKLRKSLLGDGGCTVGSLDPRLPELPRLDETEMES